MSSPSCSSSTDKSSAEATVTVRAGLAWRVLAWSTAAGIGGSAVLGAGLAMLLRVWRSASLVIVGLLAVALLAGRRMGRTVAGLGRVRGVLRLLLITSGGGRGGAVALLRLGILLLVSC